MDEYQWWLDHNPVYLHGGAIEQIEAHRMRDPEGGTNDVYRAQYWIERPGNGALRRRKSSSKSAVTGFPGRTACIG